MMARAQRGLDRRTSAGAIEAIREYNAVVRRDSTYQPAWSGLAKTYVRAYIRNFTLPGIPRDSMLSLAVRSVERALAVDSMSAEAWVAQAQVSRAVDPTELPPAFRAVRRAITLDSLSGPGWHTLALSLAETGDFPGAMAAWQRCVTVAPGYAEGVAFRGLAYYWRRQYDSAQIWVDSAVALDPNYILARTVGGYVAIERGAFGKGAAVFDAARRLGDDIEIVNALAGRALAEAREGQAGKARVLLREADSLATSYAPTPLHTAVYLGAAHAGLGDVTGALRWLSRVEALHDLHFQLHLRCDPPFDPIAADRRFQQLLLMPRPSGKAGC